MPIQKILVPTDFSDCAKAALDYALEVSPTASITLLHAYELPTYALADGTILSLDTIAVEQIDESVDAALRAERQRVSSRREVRVERSNARPVDAILAAARQNQTDLIVMGTHGRTGLKRMFLGSVAEHVVRAAPCPVLIVRNKESP